MKTSPKNEAIVPATKRVFPRLGKYFSAWLVLGLLLVLGVARVQGQDDDYLVVYSIIDQADALNASGKMVQAHNKYIEAKRAMVTFQQNYPDWKTSTVNFRLKYLDQKIAATTASAVPATTPAPANSAPAGASQTSVTPGSSPVKLLDAGSEPRKVISLHPAAGDRQSLSMTTKMSMSMSMSSSASQMPAMNIPTMVMTMDVAVKDVSPDGDITFGVTFGDANVVADANTTPGMADAMKTALSGMSGMTGAGKMSGQGVAHDVQFNLPPGAAPQLSQTVDQMKESFSMATVAWPAEAIGPGAKWEYAPQIKSQGMTIDQTIDYELVSVDGDQLTLRTTTKQNAANQTIESPAMPGMKVKLIKMTGTGNANTTFNLAHIMPQKAGIDGDTEVIMDMGQQGQMDMKMKMNVMLEGK